MSERSIAEIIGKATNLPHDARGMPGEEVFAWTCPQCEQTLRDLGDDPPCTVDWRPTLVTVDDMLGWLYANGYAAEMFSNRNEGDRDIYGGLRRYCAWTEDPAIEFEGPTLHAALEGAVRAVDAQKEPT